MKTYYREADYRVDWMKDLFNSLNHGFNSIQEKLNNIDYFDGIFAQEQAESIFGIAFITAQTYITGTLSDMAAIGGDSKLQKSEMLSIGSPIITNEITKILLINTIANYYKHHEEWTGWKVEGHNRKTIKTLNKCGITEDTQYPCHEAAQIVWPTEAIFELNNLLKKIGVRDQLFLIKKIGVRDQLFLI